MKGALKSDRKQKHQDEEKKEKFAVAFGVGDSGGYVSFIYGMYLRECGTKR
jgi:hypothetical protein